MYIGPVPTCYAAVRLQLHSCNPNLSSNHNLLKLKLAHWLLPPWGKFTPVLVFVIFFSKLGVRTGQTDRWTGKTCNVAYYDGRMIIYININIFILRWLI